MLAFRSEAHVDAWCEERGVERGATFSLQQAWALARGWYGDRLAPDWRRRTPEQAQAILEAVGLTGEFWKLG